MRVRIEQELQRRPAINLNDPFAILRPILDEVVRACDDDTWRVAKTVRRVEKVWNLKHRKLMRAACVAKL